MTEMNHRFVEANGIRVHISEQGKGPLVILCHGWPELGYSWRHQLPALAKAGYHAVAPDQRGYGRSDRPQDVKAYGIFHLVGDMVGLVQAIGEETAVIVGHDWGAPVAWHCGLLRPDIFRAVGLLSVPYIQRSSSDPQPTVGMKRMAGDKEFYQLYFQEEGKAEKEFEADIQKTMRTVLYSASGDPSPEERWRFLFEPSEGFLEAGTLPAALPPWLTEEDIEVFAAAFKESGFRGGLNWYRNLDRNWEMTRFLIGARLRQPTLFIAGERDAVILMYRRALDTMEETVPDLRGKAILPGAGHWIQQERPAEVNEALLEFLSTL